MFRGCLGKMRECFIISVLCFIPLVAHANILPLYDALRATYTACVGIDDELHDLKVMAGINTAVTAVGTAAAGGATVVGLVKTNTDKQIAELEKLLEKLRQIDNQRRAAGTVANNDGLMIAMAESFANHQNDIDVQQQTLRQEIEEKTKKSKSLGNWRTGLIATSTVTNVSGAIIAGTGQSTGDLQAMIDECKTAIANLRQSIGQARLNGEDVSEARDILALCDEYNYVDISKITNRAKGAMISSIVGATTGAVGTVTSAMANSNKIRNDNTDSGKNKEKNLNTAANVLSGATAAASATATVFNATQISAIKKVASVAEKCTGVLK